MSQISNDVMVIKDERSGPILLKGESQVVIEEIKESEKEEESAFSSNSYFMKEQEDVLKLKFEAHEDEEDQHEELRKNVKEGVEWVKTKLLGQGSFGSVYQAIDSQLGTPITVKQIPISGLDATSREERIENLRTEIELLSNLTHPNIVKFYGSSLDENFINIFLEYVGGGSLEHMYRQYSFSEDLIRKFTR